MPNQDPSPSRPSPSILPCEVCKYDLNGLGSGTYVVCPECGLEQPRRTALPPWPDGWHAAAWQSGVTFALCNLCLLGLIPVALGADKLFEPLLVLAGLTFLSGMVVPIVSALVLSRRHGQDGIHRFIPLGWSWNFLIGMGYLVMAFVVGIAIM